MSTQSGPPAARTGVIHDIGYRHYQGPRLGRAAIIRALGWHSLRSAFGIGRGAKAKIIPVIAFVLICVPAVVNAISLATHGGQVLYYDTYDAVRDAVADLGLPLNRLEQRRRRVEELFRDEIPDREGAA